MSSTGLTIDHAFGPGDITCVAIVPGRAFVLEEITDFSISTQFDKIQVRRLGRRLPVGIATGAGTIAGSLIAHQTTQAALWKLRRHAGTIRMAAETGVLAEMDEGRIRQRIDHYTTSILPQQLPPFHLMFVHMSDAGQMSIARLYNVHIASYSEIKGANNAYTEESMQYQALFYEPIRLHRSLTTEQMAALVRTQVNSAKEVGFFNDPRRVSTLAEGLSEVIGTENIDDFADLLLTESEEMDRRLRAGEPTSIGLADRGDVVYANVDGEYVGANRSPVPLSGTASAYETRQAVLTASGTTAFESFGVAVRNDQVYTTRAEKIRELMEESEDGFLFNVGITPGVQFLANLNGGRASAEVPEEVIEPEDESVEVHPWIKKGRTVIDITPDGVATSTVYDPIVLTAEPPKPIQARQTVPSQSIGFSEQLVVENNQISGWIAGFDIEPQQLPDDIRDKFRIRGVKGRTASHFSLYFRQRGGNLLRESKTQDSIGTRKHVLKRQSVDVNFYTYEREIDQHNVELTIHENFRPQSFSFPKTIVTLKVTELAYQQKTLADLEFTLEDETKTQTTPVGVFTIKPSNDFNEVEFEWRQQLRYVATFPITTISGNYSTIHEGLEATLTGEDESAVLTIGSDEYTGGSPFDIGAGYTITVQPQGENKALQISAPDPEIEELEGPFA